MPSLAGKRAKYTDLYELPENMIGEIISGQLVATPRPGPRHAVAASALGSEICGPFQLGKGGPGGWWILDEPELHLGEHVIVPDLAGWRKERLPSPLPEESGFSVPPDWVCELVSPSTARHDRIRKVPLYAQYRVQYLWLVDPAVRTFEAFRLKEGNWSLFASHAEDEKIRAEPFQEIELDLALLWG